MEVIIGIFYGVDCEVFCLYFVIINLVLIWQVFPQIIRAAGRKDTDWKQAFNVVSPGKSVHNVKLNVWDTVLWK